LNSGASTVFRKSVPEKDRPRKRPSQKKDELGHFFITGHFLIANGWEILVLSFNEK